MAEKPDNVLGKIPCLVCITPVVLRANKNDLAYFGCSECGCQVMTRARAADVKLRQRLTTTTPAPPAPAPNKEQPREEKKPAAPAATKRAGIFGRG